MSRGVSYKECCRNPQEYMVLKTSMSGYSETTNFNDDAYHYYILDEIELQDHIYY